VYKLGPAVEIPNEGILFHSVAGLQLQKYSKMIEGVRFPKDLSFSLGNHKVRQCFGISLEELTLQFKKGQVLLGLYHNPEIFEVCDKKLGRPHGLQGYELSEFYQPIFD